MRRLNRSSIAGLLFARAFALGGCENLTSGGVGELKVVVAADSVSVSDNLQLAPSAVASVGPLNPQAPSDRIVGTLTVRIQVFVLRLPAQWIEVTDGVQEVILPIGDSEPATIAQMRLPAGPYRAVRTLFRRGEADVRSGLVVDGELVTGRIPVHLGPEDRLQIETGLELDVVEERASTLVVDLHAARWLRRLDRDLRQVSSEHFEDELRLRHRQ